jgi:dolichol-phosphate mannosyltransferase
MPERHQNTLNQPSNSLTFSKVEYFRKKNRYALLIPVINEGERIQNQLKLLKNANFKVDIIICDGGSTDESLNDSFLKSNLVRVLLLKTGPGKLSSQLRIGYSWCLDQGYLGVITMDGNGKDDIDGITHFVQMLDKGYDYVQGSRYMQGGKSVNTPNVRALAIKLIHAPLISLSAGFRFTDTTNGFRGYSKKLLENKKLGIFRSVFNRYNLLFYISSQAPKLGLSCIEVPVCRRYPEHGVIPTKIDSFGGKVHLLYETINAVIGRYNLR